jgi:hypothetical protein
MIEMIKNWTGYISSMFIGAIGLLDKCKELFDLAFVILGCIGLILSIKLTLKKLNKYDRKDVHE